MSENDFLICGNSILKKLLNKNSKFVILRIVGDKYIINGLLHNKENIMAAKRKARKSRKTARKSTARKTKARRSRKAARR